jgi:membrane protease YdiL (CAAX protease family)
MEGEGQPEGPAEGEREPAAGLGPPPPDPARFVRWGLLFYGVMAAVAVLWRIGLYREPLLYASAAAAREGLRPGADAALGAAAGAGILLLSHLTTRYTSWGERLAQALARSLGELSVPNALLLALASGLAEELLFRGALQPRVGWVWASLLFGLLHFVPRREFLPWTLFAVGAGFLFGALFEQRGNLVAPVVAHVLVNAVNLPLLIRDYGARAARSQGDPERWQ